MAEKNRSKRKEPQLAPAAASREMPPTDFAITTVNFPDRLDAREVSDRQIESDRSRRQPRIDSYVVGQWLRRLFVVVVLGALVYGAVALVRPIREQMSPPRLSDRLSKALGQPVTVQASGFRASPSPRLTLTGVQIGDAVRLDEVSMTINWPEALQALRGARWTGGEAAVAPTKITTTQAAALVALLPRLGAALPGSMTTLRFESLQFADAPLLPGRYEVVSRRAATGGFESLIVQELGIEGQMALTLTPAAGSDQVAFAVDASSWKAPLMNAVRWNEVNSTGTLAPHQIDANFSISGFYGVTQGSLSLVQGADGEDWNLTGKASGSNLDVEAIIGQAIGRDAATVVKGDATIPVNGTASMSLALAGLGPTPDAALRGMAVAGPAQIRWATLNGINLGYIATRPSPGGLVNTGGGNTRFTDFDAFIVADANSVLLRDIVGKAGAMSAHGQVKLAGANQLTGTIRVDLGASRVQAPLQLKILGTLEKPLYGS
jgi:hypothetical protein